MVIFICWFVGTKAHCEAKQDELEDDKSDKDTEMIEQDVEADGTEEVNADDFLFVRYTDEDDPINDIVDNILNDVNNMQKHDVGKKQKREQGKRRKRK